MIRLLLDQGLPRSAVSALRQADWDVVHIGERGHSAAPDAEILNMALAEGRVICTLDADFHALLAHSGAFGPSVIRVRREGLRGPEISALLIAIEPRITKALDRGAAISVTEKSIRIRYLPIGSSRSS